MRVGHGRSLGVVNPGYASRTATGDQKTGR
jgi:hypothetical protein